MKIFTQHTASVDAHSGTLSMDSDVVVPGLSLRRQTNLLTSPPLFSIHHLPLWLWRQPPALSPSAEKTPITSKSSRQINSLIPAGRVSDMPGLKGSARGAQRRYYLYLLKKQNDLVCICIWIEEKKWVHTWKCICFAFNVSSWFNKF